MNSGVSYEYDGVGDTLYLRICPPYDEQDSVLEENGSIMRSNPTTRVLEGLELMSYSRWSEEELAALDVPEAFKRLVVGLAECTRIARG